MPPILIDFYMAMVDLGLGPRMIQLTINRGLLKPGFQNGMWLYQHHLPSITSQDRQFRDFCPAKALHRHPYSFEGREVLFFFNLCPI